MSFTSNNNEADKVVINFNSITIKPFMGWSKFFAIYMIITSVITCLGIITLPIGIFGIIAGIKLLNTCTDLKAVMETENPVYSMYAGDNLCETFKNLCIRLIVYFVTVIVLIAAAITLVIIFADEILAFLREHVDEFEAWIDDIDSLAVLAKIWIK